MVKDDLVKLLKRYRAYESDDDPSPDWFVDDIEEIIKDNYGEDFLKQITEERCPTCGSGVERCDVCGAIMSPDGRCMGI